MRRSLPPLLALFIAALPLAASAAPPEDQWFTVLLDGRKIGSFEAKREVRGREVHTTQTLEIELERAGVKVALGSSESATETVDGAPLAFASTSRLSGSETRIDGRVRDGSIDLDTTTGGATQHRKMPWPAHALLPEGLRLAGVRADVVVRLLYLLLHSWQVAVQVEAGESGKCLSGNRHLRNRTRRHQRRVHGNRQRHGADRKAQSQSALHDATGILGPDA